VQPDERLYGSLMSVAGAAGDVGLAFSLLDEMEAEGLRPSKVLHQLHPTP
jgi:pentatricopeptide repeat protein